MKQIGFAPLCMVAFLMLHSCANKVAPTGGDKDLLPPVLLSASPGNYEVNFKAKKITLTFDEYVQLKEVQKQVMISPPMEPAPQIELRKRSVIITLPDTLKSNTTYTINFGTSISDFTEGNSLPGFQYVFSTGSVLDSLVLAGQLMDALTLKPMKDALALVYDSGTADSLIGQSPPLYYARTNEGGFFIVRNVREGSYRVVGVDDKNNNLTADLADEIIGSGAGIIQLRDSAFVTTYLSKQPAAKQKINSSIREAPGKLVTVFARPVNKITWSFMGTPPPEVIAEYGTFRDTVILYGFPSVADSTSVIWFENGLVVDTVLYRSSKKAALIKTPVVQTLEGNSYPPNAGTLAPETQPYFRWSAPLQSFEFAKVKVLKDSVDYPVEGAFKDSLQVITGFSGSWAEGNFEIIIPAGAAVDRYGRTNDSIRFSFVNTGDEATGSISFTFTPSVQGNVLLQLVNDKDEIVRQRNITEKISGTFGQVGPGIYRFRIVYDTNNNGRWDSGDLRNNSFPEKVIYYKDPVTVRANWEVEVSWTE